MSSAVKCWLFSGIELWNLTGAVGTSQQPLGKIPSRTLLYWGSDCQIRIFYHLLHEGVFHADSLSCKGDETAATHGVETCVPTNLSYSPF